MNIRSLPSLMTMKAPHTGGAVLASRARHPSNCSVYDTGKQN